MKRKPDNYSDTAGQSKLLRNSQYLTPATLALLRCKPDLFVQGPVFWLQKVYVELTHELGLVLLQSKSRSASRSKPKTRSRGFIVKLKLNRAIMFNHLSPERKILQSVLCIPKGLNTVKIFQYSSTVALPV